MVMMLGTLAIGVVLGYLGQRSRLCFVGGLRDFILVRDTRLLKGLVGFTLTAWVVFPAAALVAAGDPAPRDFDLEAGALTMLGAGGVGFFSTLANGCPFRQHVMAAQGAVSSLAYLAGFFGGAVVFHRWVGPLLGRFI